MSSCLTFGRLEISKAQAQQLAQAMVAISPENQTVFTTSDVNRVAGLFEGFKGVKVVSVRNFTEVVLATNPQTDTVVVYQDRPTLATAFRNQGFQVATVDR